MTRRLLVASTNQGKLVEIRKLLDGLPVAVVGLGDYPDAPDLPEPFDTFADNAASKAQAAADFAGCLALADDSGLQVDALGGRPGVLSARYAPTDAERIAKLLAELESFAGEARRARFVCAVALAAPGGALGLWQRTCEGLIAPRPAGDNGFGFDPVFLYEGRTFAQLTAEEKNEVSHRGQAMRAFAADFAGMLHELD